MGQILGTVISAPGGIACGLPCVSDTATYPSGTVVTLTAQSVLGAFFASWTGDCAGTTTTCVVTMDADRNVVAHFSLLRPSAADAPTTDPAGRLLLRSRLTVSGGRGEVTANGRTVSLAGGVETEIAIDARSGDAVVEAWVREGAGEGVWRFGFGTGAPEGRSIRNVLAGEPVTLTPDTVVFRVKGRLPRRVAFVVRRSPESADAPPAR